MVHVADLFALPSAWIGSFDLAVEVFTVQSIEPADQARAAAAIRSLVGPGATLVAVTLVQLGHRDPEGPPWPVLPSTLAVLAAGLTESDRHVEELDGNVSCILVELAHLLG